MNLKEYIKILKRKLLRNLPSLSPYTKLRASLNEENRLIFQQDRSSVHMAKSEIKHFDTQGPPNSPDLNLIESVGSHLKSQLKRSYKNRKELEKDIIYQSLIIYLERIYKIFIIGYVIEFLL